MIKRSVSTMKEMVQDLHNDIPSSRYWPTINGYWTLLERNELIKDLTVSDFDRSYCTLRYQQRVTGDSLFVTTRRELQEILETFQIKIKARLLTEEDEVLSYHTARLTLSGSMKC